MEVFDMFYWDRFFVLYILFGFVLVDFVLLIVVL